MDRHSADPRYAAIVATPVGPLGLLIGNERLCGVDFLDSAWRTRAPGDPLAREAVRQLRAYFTEPGWRFDLPLEELGTPFQRRVWQALRAIPAGHTRTYGALAETLGSAARAIGGACRGNPLVVVTPCHRVIARNGIGGFAGHTRGAPVARKRWLLAHESRAR
jgi:methylated-DNA-[protein]-cysteine S-methyltransferase